MVIKLITRIHHICYSKSVLSLFKIMAITTVRNNDKRTVENKK
jgi:hypothetical protein